MTWKDWKQMDSDDREEWIEYQWEDLKRLNRYYRFRLRRDERTTGKVWGCSFGGLWLVWFDLYTKKYVFEMSWRKRYGGTAWVVQIPPRKVFPPPPPPVVYERALSIPLKDFDNSGKGE